MKKFNILLCIGLMAVLPSRAQSDFPLQFVDENGQIIADGTELDIIDYEEDELFGDIIMPTKVWVKNVSVETVQGGGSYTIQAIDNGWFQTCFPMNCMRHGAEGTFETESDAFIPSQTRSMQTEWLPNGEGICIVVYQLVTYRKVGKNYLPDEDGPTITLNYYYGTTGLARVKGGKVSSVTYYDLSGQAVERPSRGIYMKKTTYSNGSFVVRKRVLR